MQKSIYYHPNIVLGTYELSPTKIQGPIHGSHVNHEISSWHHHDFRLQSTNLRLTKYTYL